jgi:hypothetical protein
VTGRWNAGDQFENDDVENWMKQMARVRSEVDRRKQTERVSQGQETAKDPESGRFLLA